MKKNFTWTFKSILTLLVNAQLVFSPLVFAQDTEVPAASGNKALQTIQAGLGLATQVAGTTMNVMQQSAQHLPQYQPRLLSRAELLQKNPALAQAGCAVLEAATDFPADNVCDPSNININDQQSVNEIFQMIATADNNESTYDLYLLNGNSNYSQGMGCYENARKQLLQEFSSKIEAFDNAYIKLLAQLNLSKNTSERALQGIRRQDALINGRSKDDKYKNLDGLTFGEGFKSAACSSFMAETSFSEEGDKGGLDGIEKMLRKEVTTKKPDSYSAVDLIGDKSVAGSTGVAFNIEKDINKLAKRFERNIRKSGGLPTQLGDFTGKARTREFAATSPALSSLLEDQFDTLQVDLAEKKRTLRGLTDQDYADLESGKLTGSEIAQKYKRDQYNACMTQRMGNIRDFADRLYNPALDKQRNKEVNSSFKTTLVEYFEDPNISIEQKIEAIKRRRQSGLRLKNDNETRIDDTTYAGNTFIDPIKAIEQYKQECDGIYLQANSSTENSQAQVEAQIRNYGNYVQTKKREFAVKVREEVRNQLLYCPDDNNTGVGALSCSEAFNKKSSNFCLKTAKICAGNQQTCLDEAKTILRKARTDQQNLANEHNAFIKKVQRGTALTVLNMSATIEADFRTIDNKYKSLGTTYKSPNMNATSKLGSNLLKGLESVGVQDFDKYVEALKKDLDAQRDAMTKHANTVYGANVFKKRQIDSDGNQQNLEQQESPSYEYAQYKGFKNGFLGQLGGFARNAEIDKKRWSELKNKCKQAKTAYDQQYAQAMQQKTEDDKKTAENNARMQAQCEQARAYKKDQCEGVIAVASFDMFSIVDRLEGSSNSSGLKDYCEGKVQELQEIRTSTDEEKLDYVASFCADDENKSKSECSSGKLFCADKDLAITADSEKMKFCIGFKEEDGNKIYNNQVSLKTNDSCPASSEEGKYSEIMSIDNKFESQLDSIVRSKCVTISDYETSFLKEVYAYHGKGNSINIGPTIAKCDAIAGSQINEKANGANNILNSIFKGVETGSAAVRDAASVPNTNYGF